MGQPQIAREAGWRSLGAMTKNTVVQMPYTMTSKERLAWISLAGRNDAPAGRDAMLREAREVYERRVAQAKGNVEAVLAIFQAAQDLGVFPVASDEELKTLKNRFLTRAARLGADSANE